MDHGVVDFVKNPKQTSVYFVDQNDQNPQKLTSSSAVSQTPWPPIGQSFRRRRSKELKLARPVWNICNHTFIILHLESSESPCPNKSRQFLSQHILPQCHSSMGFSPRAWLNSKDVPGTWRQIHGWVIASCSMAPMAPQRFGWGETTVSHITHHSALSKWWRLTTPNSDGACILYICTYIYLYWIYSCVPHSNCHPGLYTVDCGQTMIGFVRIFSRNWFLLENSPYLKAEFKYAASLSRSLYTIIYICMILSCKKIVPFARDILLSFLSSKCWRICG